MKPIITKDSLTTTISILTMLAMCWMVYDETGPWTAICLALSGFGNALTINLIKDHNRLGTQGPNKPDGK